MPRAITYFTFIFTLFSAISLVHGANSTTSLPQLGTLLKEAESVTVHKQSQQQLLVSWSDDGRKLSGKTLRIFERIVGGVKSNKNIHVYVSISAEEVDNAPGLAQLNSDYKANYIQKALLKQCGNACQASVAGIGSAINANKVFVAIFKGESGKPSLVAFE